MFESKGRPLTGREYVRVSKDRSGRMASVADQHKENAADAEREGIRLGESYREERDVSASRYSSKARDGFGDLLADLASGAFGADLLYLWESSRGSRKVGEWVTLIDLCDEAGVLIRVTTHGRTYDPRNGRDRRTLLEDAVDSEYESYKTSTRTRRTAAEMAAEGRPTGVCPWGYLPIHDTRSGKLITWEPDPDKAPLVRELFERIAAGHSFRAITADWAERGIVNKSGNPFVPQNLRRLAVREAYAGLRVHHGATTPGTWEPLVAPELWHTVQRILSDPKRCTTRSGRAVHTLTMIMRCGECGGPIVVGPPDGKGDRRYTCRDHRCITAEKPPIDAQVIGAMLSYLSREDVYQALQAGSEEGPELAAVREQLAAARSELAEAEQAEAETVAEARAFAKLADKLSKKIRDLEEQERDFTTPSALRRLIEPGADVHQRWEDLPVSAKRDVARILLTPEILGEVRIKKATKRGRGSDPTKRLEWYRHDHPHDHQAA